MTPPRIVFLSNIFLTLRILSEEPLFLTHPFIRGKGGKVADFILHISSELQMPRMCVDLYLLNIMTKNRLSE